MSLADDLSLLKNQVSVMYSYFDTQRKVGGKDAKMPRRVLRKVRKGLKKNRILVPFFGSNKGFEFLIGHIDGGLVRVGDDSYRLDPKAIYTWKKGKVPVYGLLQWRLDPIGSDIDSIHGVLEGLGADKAFELATQLNITNFGQKTIIRGIQAEELAVDSKKKKKMPIIMWIVVGLALLWIISKMFSGGATP